MATPLITVGIILAILGAFISALGLVLQKKSHVQNAKVQSSERKGFLTRPLWIAGFVLYTTGNLINVVALTFAPQSVVSALATLVLVGNAIFAPLLLGEKLGGKDVIATVVIIMGTLLTVFYGSKSSPSYSATDLAWMFLKTPFIVYSVLVFIAAIGGMAYTHVIEKRNTVEVVQQNATEDGTVEVVVRERTRGDAEDGSLALNADTPEEPAAAAPAPKKEFMINPEIYRLDTNQSKFIGISYAFATGLLSSFNILFSKISGELVKESFSGDNQFTNVITYVFIVLFIICNVTQIKLLQKSLSCFDALFIVPVYQVLFTVLAILAGGIFFSEFSGFDITQAIVFPLGCFFTILGVVVLSMREIRTFEVVTAKITGLFARAFSRANATPRELDEENVPSDEGSGDHADTASAESEESDSDDSDPQPKKKIMNGRLPTSNSINENMSGTASATTDAFFARARAEEERQRRLRNKQLGRNTTPDLVVRDPPKPRDPTRTGRENTPPRAFDDIQVAGMKRIHSQGAHMGSSMGGYYTDAVAIRRVNSSNDTQDLAARAQRLVREQPPAINIPLGTMFSMIHTQATPSSQTVVTFASRSSAHSRSQERSPRQGKRSKEYSPRLSGRSAADTPPAPTLSAAQIPDDLEYVRGRTSSL